MDGRPRRRAQHRHGRDPLGIVDLINRPVSGRALLVVGLVLIVLDVAALGVAGLVALKQQDTIDALNEGVCRNSAIIADGLDQDIKASRNTELYRSFFPDVPQAQLDEAIASQVARQRKQRHDLREGCPPPEPAHDGPTNPPD